MRAVCAGKKNNGVSGGRTNAGKLALRQHLRQCTRRKGTYPTYFLLRLDHNKCNHALSIPTLTGTLNESNY